MTKTETNPVIRKLDAITMGKPFVELSSKNEPLYPGVFYVKLKYNVNETDAVLAVSKHSIYTIYKFTTSNDANRRFAEINLNEIHWAYRADETTFVNNTSPLFSANKATDEEYFNLLKWVLTGSGKYPFTSNIPPNPKDFAAVEKEKEIVKTEKDIAPTQTTRKRQTWFYYNKENGMKEWYQIEKIDETENYIHGYHNGQYKSFLKSKISNRSDDN